MPLAVLEGVPPLPPPWAHRLMGPGPGPMGPVLSPWARLARRVHEVQKLEDAGEAVEALLALDLVAEDVEWAERASRSTVAELKQAARALGLTP